jgi:endo-1,4-beta-xylanase
MLTRRNFLAAAALVPAAAHAQALRPSIDEDEVSLCGAASAHGLAYGCAVAGYELDQPDFRAALQRETSVLVAEYEMKRQSLQPEPGRYDFAAADRLTGFARDHGLAFRGHTLVWYHSNPSWLDEAVRETRKESLFTGYITDVMRHFGGSVQSWDVVNEIVELKDGRSDGLRNSIWLETFGPGFIDTALHAARAAAPAAELVYNDWGCELAGPEHDRFRAATLKLLEGLKARNVPIDALGLQGHLPAFGKTIDQKALSRFLDGVHALGLRVLVTEHDVDDSGGPLDIPTRDRAVADASARFLDVVATHPACSAVLSWGLSDRFLDQPQGFAARLEGYSPRMLPLDTDLRPKPMRAAMRRAFSAR